MSFDIEPEHHTAPPDKEDWYVAENRALRHALYELTAYSLTARTLHREWLVELAERVNNALITLGEDDRAIVPIEPIEGNGASMQLILKKAAPIGRMNGRDIIL